MAIFRFKAAALAIGCVLALQGCGEAVEVDDPVEAVEVEAPRKEPDAEKLKLRAIEVQKSVEHRKAMRQFAKVALAFKEPRCEEGLDLLEAAGADETQLISKAQYGTFRAILYIEGICQPRDPARAVQLLSDVIDDEEWPEALARLGALYLQGDGVDQDTAKADNLFQSAVLSQVTFRLSNNDPSNAYRHLGPFEEIWDMSENDMHLEFVSYLTGPWQLPAPLRAQMEWLDQVKAGGGAAIFETSEKFKNGTGGFDRNEKVAFIMLETSARYHQYSPAQYPFAMALRDGELCPKRSSHCEKQDRRSDYDFSLSFIYNAGEHDHLQAQQYLVSKLQHVELPDRATEEQRTDLNEAYYYWLLRFNVNQPQAQDRIAEAARNLTREDRTEIEQMVAQKDPALFSYDFPDYPAELEVDDSLEQLTEQGDWYDEYMANMRVELRQTVHEFANIASVFKERRCEEAIDRLEIAGTGGTQITSRVQFATYRAILYMDGICEPRDPARAAEMLSNVIDGDEEPEALARLGALYLQGDGVDQDAAMATKLFRRAVLSQIEGRLYPGPFREDDIYAPYEELWGMSYREMRLEFVSYLTGPWQLPAPLRAQMEWLDQVKAGGGEAIFEASEKFKTGTDEFEQDEKLAFIMLEIAATDYDYIPAKYPYAMALRDDELCPKRTPLCDILYRGIDFGSSLPHIYLAAENDDLRAQQFLVDKLGHLKLPDDDTEDRRDSLNETYYYWILRLNLSREQSEDRIEEARQAVSRSERGWIEELIADKDPSGLLFYFREPRTTTKDFPANQTP